MCKLSRFGITAEHTGSDMFVTAHSLCEDPLSLAGEKAAQLYALLYTAAGKSAGRGVDIQGHLLSLAAGLAHETLVLSELAAQHEKEKESRLEA
jgi:hypothetical protein